MHSLALEEEERCAECHLASQAILPLHWHKPSIHTRFRSPFQQVGCLQQNIKHQRPEFYPSQGSPGLFLGSSASAVSSKLMTSVPLELDISSIWHWPSLGLVSGAPGVGRGRLTARAEAHAGGAVGGGGTAAVARPVLCPPHVQGVRLLLVLLGPLHGLQPGPVAPVGRHVLRQPPLRGGGLGVAPP